MGGPTRGTPHHVDPRGDVPPLIAPAHLQFDAVSVVQMPEVVRLQEHVAELGVREADLAGQAGLHRVLGEHLTDRDVLADIAKELQHRHRCRPLGVVDQGRRVALRAEVQEALQLRLDRGDVVVEFLACEQVALLGAAARVAHHAGSAPGQGEHPMTGVLETTETDLTEEMSDVQRISRRIEADVDADRTRCQPGAQRISVGRVVHQTALLELGDQIHPLILP